MNYHDIENVKAIDNTLNLQDISSSVFIIHGLKDEVIPNKYSQEMRKKILKSIYWFPKEGTHNNIPTLLRDKFYTKILFFFNNIKYNNITKEASLNGTSVGNSGLNVGIKFCSMRLEENYIKTNSSDMLANQKFLFSNSDKVDIQIENEDENNNLNMNTNIRNTNLSNGRYDTDNNIDSSINIKTIMKKSSSGVKSKKSKKNISIDKISTSHDEFRKTNLDDIASIPNSSMESDFESFLNKQEQEYDLIKNNDHSN